MIHVYVMSSTNRAGSDTCVCNEQYKIELATWNEMNEAVCSNSR